MNRFIQSISCALAFRLAFLLVVSAICLLAPAQCIGGGILHVFPPTFQGQAFAVARPTVLRSRTEVTVTETYIEYKSDQTFFNDNEFPLEGIFIFPLGKGQPDVIPEVLVNGVPNPSTVASSKEFFPELKRHTIAVHDPSLLCLAGKTVLVVQPVNIGVRAQKSFRIQYRQPFSIRDDQFELKLPLDGERYSLGPVADFNILVRFKLSRPLRTIFSPTHHLSVSKEAPHRCLVSTGSQSKRIREDFRILGTVSGDDLDLRLFATKRHGRKGSFMAFIAPPEMPAGEKEREKDVVFLMDRSGSIGVANFDLCKQAVIAGLQRLRPGDRFNVLTFGTRTASMQDRPIPANSENVTLAARFLNSQVTEGGSDLYNGLLDSLEQFSSRRRPSTVLLVGDGRPTVGVTSPDTIIENLRRLNKVGTRVFALAVGERTDITLLDKIAQITRGSSFRFSGKESFPTVVNRFLAGISPPSVTRLSLEFQNIAVKEVYPEPIPDIFSEDSVILFGRVAGLQDTNGKVRLKARVKDHLKDFTLTVRFPEPDDSRPYITDIWAMRRISALLEQERLKGPEQETTDEIGKLTRKFGFQAPPSPGQPQADPGGIFWRFKTSFVPEDVESNLVRKVEGKVFRREGNAWVDMEYTGSSPAQSVRFLSEEYFDVLKRHPWLGPFLALGPEIVLATSEGAIRVIAGSPETHDRK